MTQYGFYFDQSRCDGCRACVIACRDWNDLAPGTPVKWGRVFEWEKGAFASQRLNFLFAPCYHCENPLCVDAANGAMYKEDKYGAVLIDPDKATSIDLRKAQEVCPYGSIQFDSDAIDATASKCTMCIDRLEQGLNPSCAEACILRALDFGPLSDLLAKYGTNRDLEDVPSSATTQPSVIFKPHSPKKTLVSYDANRALALMQARPSGLPPFFNAASDVTQVPPGLVFRDTLVMKPKNVAEAMKRTQCEEA